MTPRFFEHNACLLKDERGVTILEVLVAVVVLAVLVLSVYIGIMYAERQSTLNHQYRAATLLASSELDRQYFFNRYHADQSRQTLLPFSNRSEVLVDLDDDTPLMAKLSVSVSERTDIYGDQLFPYIRVTSTVSWNYPKQSDKHKIVLQEDHYPR
ncbi:MAG: prepilin-type N-terminal cleavage/methylation domain-containing protein [Candidatus Cloacimonadaceae bacterium]|jgi:prepilin-type N-terminal cleavage/methylation domain-containing protein|nr:prepilin-type N-terminal cleavage/methylation domain-containing protein [Candidatus Cloacimonadota bacterium]MDY0127064.1 prepilin-type N-terminal cleavage/methylation domain-containing protein [Candidatus Cloacimonadaceae bacterium]MCB5254743.1 prepilin-type N-terminal cleavage/methylation domain-containing protein [Candidatus Cloacimonadota bacterium]MCK9177870.1 prepilin-type N-terminal cleavage/methylation domain-containing protein [Candidatus Cloacimonadota bacterium]MCK9242707.1 prepil